jgi:uncharacterized protein YndB with AHSA1/START domain
MKPSLPFEFIVAKESSQLILRRTFSASRQLVWNCFTQSALLNQWFAPKPMTTMTKSMEFREGGHWHYAMIHTDGHAYWGYMEYITISPIDFYTSLDAFSNEEGEVKNLPRAIWTVAFSGSGDITFVAITIQYDSLADMETVLKMGMEQGMTATLEKLDELLATLV